MDLRSIINNNEAGESAVSKQAAPVTPVQAHPHQGFHREYSHPPQASPGKHLSQDYGTQPGGAYNSPTAYQGNYQGRPPPPPPIQAPPHNDLRSPARSYSAQSPYQPTSSSSASQYPFPQTYQTPQSPAQHQQYPSTLQQRDSYPQANPPPHLQHHNSYSQASPAPQTPPIGIPGAPHPILQHQRSQSSLSNSTPTSAHSQQQYFGNQYPQDSPISTTTTPFPPSQLAQHQRQQSQQSQHSQPGTPLGPPLNQRQSSGPFGQPTSPYQQRGLPQGPFTQFQTSPAQPASASIPRLPSTPSAYDPHSQRNSTSEQHRGSQSERERSVSVSPKTRLPSQPRGEIMTPHMENGYNSGKRKMEERNAIIEEPRRVGENELRPQVNGDNKVVSGSPQQPPKKRIRYTEPPIWARSVRSKAALGLSTKGNSRANGKPPLGLYPAHQAPPPIKAETNGNRQVSPAINRAIPPHNLAPDRPQLLLGPWEESIANNIPKDEISRLVADFLYSNVVSRGDLGELASRGVDIEIEAKLGQLIDADTNERINLKAVSSECVLRPSQGIKFKSSMTETQHRCLNEFLNKIVVDTSPSNPQAEGRVKVDYKHRRERDSFYELPPAAHANLPAAVREVLNPRHRVKVRISHDQKTDQILAMIIKARIVNLDIYMPQQHLDCRISINLEMKYDGTVEEIMAASVGDRQADRNKDRLSYTQSHYQIDLTQVTQTTIMSNGVTQPIKEHELEIEVSTLAIREQGQRAASSAPNQYLALVGGLVNNVRVLARATPPP